MNQFNSKKIDESAISEVRNSLSKMTDQFKAALPANISVEKFNRVVMTTIQINPDILECDRKSLFIAATRAAQVGLLPDGREGAIVAFKGKAQFLPMVGGILKLIYNSGSISKIDAHMVHEGDRKNFIYRPGIDEMPIHSPDWFGDRGEIVGVYAVAISKQGEKFVEIMNKAQIDKVRETSRSNQNVNAPWVNWYDEMAKKTVIKRLAKRLPMSSELMDLLNDDDHDFRNDSTKEVIDVDDQLVKKPRKERVSRLENLIDNQSALSQVPFPQKEDNQPTILIPTEEELPF
jgi:recombination protein RecT